MKKSKGFYLAIFIMAGILLVASVLLSFLWKDSTVFSYISGMSCGIFAVGIIKQTTLKNDPKKRKELEISENDERYIMIRQKSAYVTFSITLLALIISEIILVILNYYVALIIVIAIMFVHIFSFLIALYYYNKKL